MEPAKPSPLGPAQWISDEGRGLVPQPLFRRVRWAANKALERCTLPAQIPRFRHISGGSGFGGPELAKEHQVSTMLENQKHTPAMTNIATLLTRKQELLSRLEECPGPNERGEIERLLKKVDAELNAVDSPDRL
jgi:hypothetical protein